MLHRINLFIFFSVIFNFGTYGQGFEVKSINTISTTDDPRDAFIVGLDGMKPRCNCCCFSME